MDRIQYLKARVINDINYVNLLVQYAGFKFAKRINSDNPEVIGLIDMSIRNLRMQMTRSCEQGQRLAYAKREFDFRNNQNGKKETK